jgi:hypothetical protein
MVKEKGIFQLGLDVLDDPMLKPTTPKPRRKNPTAHVYKQADGSYVFKAIVHEDAYGLQSTRESTKATIYIIPEPKPQPKNTWWLRFLEYWLCPIWCMFISMLLGTFYVGCKPTLQWLLLMAAHGVFIYLQAVVILNYVDKYAEHRRRKYARSNTNTIRESTKS